MIFASVAGDTSYPVYAVCQDIELRYMNIFREIANRSLSSIGEAGI